VIGRRSGHTADCVRARLVAAEVGPCPTRAPRILTATRIYTVAAIVFLVAMALGSSQYRCGGHTGKDGFGFNLRYDSPMFRELHIQQTCPWPVNVPGGWWPDVLPRPGE